MSPAYYVISAADWSGMLDALSWSYVISLGVVFAAGVDWWGLEDRIRRHLRRRRLRAIRKART